MNDLYCFYFPLSGAPEYKAYKMKCNSELKKSFKNFQKALNSSELNRKEKKSIT